MILHAWMGTEGSVQGIWCVLWLFFFQFFFQIALLRHGGIWAKGWGTDCLLHLKQARERVCGHWDGSFSVLFLVSVSVSVSLCLSSFSILS